MAEVDVEGLAVDLDEVDFETPTAEVGEAQRSEAMLMARKLELTGIERNKAIRIAVVAARHSFHDGHAYPPGEEDIGEA